MTSGMAGDNDNEFAEWHSKNPGEEAEKEFARRYEEDYAKAILEMGSMTAKPGEQWNYNSSGVHLLLAIVARVIDQPLEKFVDEKLLGLWA